MTFFNEKQTTATGTAPGRMDVMGGIADYSGSWVLQMPISDQVTARAAFRDDSLIRVFSENIDQTFEMTIADMPNDYASARQFFSKKTESTWAAYPIGCLLVLAIEKGLSLDRGIDLYLRSDVPIGKGVSSSAALEIATMRAFERLYSIGFQGTEMATLAQKAENFVAGSPCGLMDQLASAHGLPSHLLPIQCQPDRLTPVIPLPAGIHFVGLDSGVRHAVSGASYTDVRTAAFIGYSIIAAKEGVNYESLRNKVRQELPYGGYLCNIPVGLFEKKYSEHLPASLKGAEFFKKHGGTIDPVTTVDPTKMYQVKNCTQHPVCENERVLEFMNLLGQHNIDNSICQRLGELMYISHESYSACGLGNEKTDELVDMVKTAGPASGVFGAKITGGGSGGTVCVLCQGSDGLSAAHQIFEEYQKRVGERLRFIA